MSKNISISSPFVPYFTHAEGSLSTSWAEVLPASVTPERRVSLIIQNKDASIAIEVVLNDDASTATGGLNLAAGASLSLDSYKGAVQARSASGTPVIHIAFATA
jgi:hypothetical protein